MYEATDGSEGPWSLSTTVGDRQMICMYVSYNTIHRGLEASILLMKFSEFKSFKFNFFHFHLDFKYIQIDSFCMYIQY